MKSMKNSVHHFANSLVLRTSKLGSKLRITNRSLIPGRILLCLLYEKAELCDTGLAGTTPKPTRPKGHSMLIRGDNCGVDEGAATEQKRR
ncbi:hypothetical protein T07_2264 [Trichinella nelsoni]|uniref:Uncharacterized protein n=1 Tax=Trichinella nelsoni TaxID=6336 RepID=A0A0V0RYR7_9BILA|nr:hypothetical protein T07_2264 [Trichinella nelsoni]